MVTTTSPGISVAPERTYAPRRSAGAVIWDWMTTVDHKKIGIMYIALGVIYFIVGGIEALLIRAQLATPNGKVLTPIAVRSGLHDARHDDDLPLHHPGIRRVSRTTSSR